MSQFNECTSSGQKVYVSVYLLPAEPMLVCQPLHVLRFTDGYRHHWYSFGELKSVFRELVIAAYGDTGEVPS